MNKGKYIKIYVEGYNFYVDNGAGNNVKKDK